MATLMQQEDESLVPSKATDEEVNAMLNEWNVVRCKNCGKELDMMKPREVHYINGITPVCYGGCHA